MYSPTGVILSAGTDVVVSMYRNVLFFFLYIKVVIVFLVLLGNTNCVMVFVCVQVGGVQRDDLSQPTPTCS